MLDVFLRCLVLLSGLRFKTGGAEIPEWELWDSEGSLPPELRGDDLAGLLVVKTLYLLLEDHLRLARFCREGPSSPLRGPERLLAFWGRGMGISLHTLLRHSEVSGVGSQLCSLLIGSHCHHSPTCSQLPAAGCHPLSCAPRPAVTLRQVRSLLLCWSSWRNKK